MTNEELQRNAKALTTVLGAVVGVMRCTQAVWEEALSNGIDLSYEAFEQDYWAEYGCEPPENVLDSLEIDEPNYIFGDWQKGSDGMYDYVPMCNEYGYAAVLGWLGGAPIVHVVWSDTVRAVNSMCSPCCPGQADLDSGEGEILAYALPDEFNWDG